MDIDASLVRRLIAAQFPEWADLPIDRVPHDGHDNRTFRVGATMSARMPSAQAYAAKVDVEHEWLPRLRPELPLSIPEPLARGVPGEGYPWPWSVYRWLEGEDVGAAGVAAPIELAIDLARFLAALHRVDPAGGPPPGPHNFFRGAPPATYDAETRESIEVLRGWIDVEAAIDTWEAALESRWNRPPVWLHGDVAPGNLLVREGRLSAVIDFGAIAVGDPACDLTIAWTLFSGESRAAFRAAVALDEATWTRARGWALWKALITVVQQRDTDAARANDAARVIEDVLRD